MFLSRSETFSEIAPSINDGKAFWVIGSKLEADQSFGTKISGSDKTLMRL